MDGREYAGWKRAAYRHPQLLGWPVLEPRVGGRRPSRMSDVEAARLASAVSGIPFTPGVNNGRT
jgi:hypothetical protein